MTAASATDALGTAGGRRGGAVRVRQVVDLLAHRLSFLPGLYVLGAIVAVQLSLWVDRRFTGDSLPEILTTTVDSARAVFTALAGGLITSVTLVLSMTLVAVQLASTQFSPRSLRDWLGDRVLQHTVGLALGTTVFSLLGLRATRSVDGGSTELIPDLTVIVAVVLGVAALFAVVATVDHITDSLRIDSVARRIADDTIRVIASTDAIEAGQHPSIAPAPRSLDEDDPIRQVEWDPDAACIESVRSGWVQQLDVEQLLDNLPDGSTAHVAVALGSYVPSRSPLVWVQPAPADDHPCWKQVPTAFALGDTRTMQQDVGFGVMQLTDIAVRALSPGVNDPGTATDVVSHLGNVLLALWARDDAPRSRSRDGRTVLLSQPGHADHLRHAFDPIRRYGTSDPHVLTTMVRTLRLLRAETLRRRLPGPTRPIDDLIEEIVGSADRTGWSALERRALDGLAPVAPA